MKEKDREIWTGENRHYFGEDNILYITATGELDEKQAIAWREADIKLIERFGPEGKINILIDLNEAGKPSPEARKILKELSEREGDVNKSAFFGLHPVARVLASFFISTSKNKNIRFFKTKEEALAWLKE